MGKFQDSILALTDAGYARGMDGQKMAKRFIEAGLAMMAEEFDIGYADRIVVTDEDTGKFRVERHDREAIDWLANAFGDMSVEAGDCFFVKIADNGASFSTQLVRSVDPEDVEAALRKCAETFADYEQQHLAKGTPEGDAKAERNRRMKEVCLRALAEPVDTAVLVPQERDSATSAPQRPAKVSNAPMDRAEVLGLIDEKIAGFKKHGMEEARQAFTAFSYEIAQRLEERPVDPERALAAFYEDCHKRNVKAGWWNDLATGQPKKRSVGELFILMVTELWEAYRAYQERQMDDKLPQYPGVGVEIGDLQIRLGDFAGGLMAGMIVEHSATPNPGDEMFRQIGEIAERYEAIRKTPAAKGEDETGEHLAPQPVAEMVFAKLAFNATRPDHKIENRKKEGGKVT